MIRGMKQAAGALVGHATPGKFPGAIQVVLLVLCLLPSSVVACTDMLPVPLLEDPIVAVRSQSASLRAGPGPSYAVVAQLPQGTILEVQGRNQAGEWIHVIHRGQALWIYTDNTDLTLERLADLPLAPILVSVLEPTLEPPRTEFVTLIVTAATVNVRTGPSTDFPVRTQVQQGARLQGQGLNADGNWVQVSDPTGGTESLWIYAPLTNLAEHHRAVLPVVAAPLLPVTPEPESTTAAPQDQGLPCPLVWSDEFAADGLPDSTRWEYDQRPNRWYPDALSFVTAAREANTRVEDGRLIIEVHKEEYGGRDYTAVRLVSRQAWTYGWYEIAAKLPQGRGVKSAIWMVSDSNPYGSWPGSGELDIMEFVGYKPGTIHATVHTEAYNHQIGNHHVERLQIPDASSAFHVYAMEWTEFAIRIFVDDMHYFTFENERLQDAGADQRHWPFDHPFHLILTISVGGDWAATQGIDPDIWPQRMELDYMRVYACKP